MILEHLWSYEDTPGEEAVRTHIKGLRQKLKEKGASSSLIETVYGIGYRLKPQSESNGSKQKDTYELEANFPSQFKSPVKLQQTALAINKVWQKFKGRVTEQVNILEEAAQALTQNALNQELHCQAEKEAHTLAGSLGTFGFPEGSKIARKIEKLLKAETTSSNDAAIFSTLVQTLQREIELSPQANHNVQPNSEHPLILIVDQDFTFAEELTQESVNWGLEVTLATSIAAARNKLYQEHPSVVLFNTSIYPEEENLDLLAELNARKPPVPVLFCSENRLSRRLENTCNGSNTYLQKPIKPKQALEAVQAALQAALIKVKVLAVDNDPKILALLQTLLTPWGITVTTLSEPRKFWTTLEAFKPDLLILDVEISGVSGIQLCSLVRNDSDWSELPILFLTVHNDADVVNQAFSAGADDFVSKPFIASELATRIINRLERIKLVRQIAQQENQRLTLFLEAAEIGTWDWNMLTNKITWSETHERLFGMVPGSFDGTFDTFLNCVLKSDRPSLYLKINQVRSEHTKYHHEFRIVWQDGSIHWIEAKGKLYYNTTGEVVGMLGTVTDISTRKQIEADLHKSKAELERKLIECTGELIRVNEHLLGLNGVSSRAASLTT
jgi:PAS domain S-box-containing protein